MAVGEVYECVFVHRTARQQNCLIVRHYVVSSIVGTQPGRLEIAAGLSTNWGNGIKNIIADSVTYQGIYMRMVYPTTTQQVFRTDGNGAGLLVGDQLPSNCPAVITLRAFQAPPRTRGRLYLPPPTEAESGLDGEPTAAYKVLVNTFINTQLLPTVTIVDGADEADMSPCIFSTKPPNLSYLIDYAAVRNDFGSQARRRSISRPDRSMF